jgi:hypothetical protein
MNCGNSSMNSHLCIQNDFAIAPLQIITVSKNNCVTFQMNKRFGQHEFFLVNARGLLNNINILFHV